MQDKYFTELFVCAFMVYPQESLVLAAILANTKTGNPQLFFQTFIPHLERKWNVCETSRRGQCVGFSYFIGQINRDKLSLVANLQHPKAARLSAMSPCCHCYATYPQP